MKELDRSSPPSAEAERPLRLPAFQREQLPNGLEIRMGVRRQLPEVSLRLVGQAGAGETSPAFAGLASLTARLLSQGAGDRGAPEMASWLGRIGASFSASAGYDATVLSMHTLASELNAALDYLAEVALRPTFADAEVERVRQERVDELRRKEDEPTHLANMGLARAIYGEHPYGVLSTGTAAAVSAIETSMIRDFHVERYGAGTATLVACGDIDPSHFAYLAERRFRDWDAVGDSNRGHWHQSGRPRRVRGSRHECHSRRRFQFASKYEPSGGQGLDVRGEHEFRAEAGEGAVRGPGRRGDRGDLGGVGSDPGGVREADRRATQRR